MISILLSTYNGEKYLKEQLDSLFAQTYSKIKIIVRDDGSSDDTLKILNSYDIELLQSNKNLGVKESFLALLDYAVKNTQSEHFMFCDQDDVWEKEKIEKTLKKMREMELRYPNLPLLVHTDLKVVDENLQIINESFWNHDHINPEFNKFNNLLMQNTVTGCTVMINKKLALSVLPIPENIIMHDWWLGLVASQFGKIGFIDEALILYRQHSNNSIGAKGFDYSVVIEKFYMIFYKDGFYLKRIKDNILQAKVFLDRYRDKLDKETVDMLEDFTVIESKSFWKKREILLRYRLLKQGFLRNLGLFLKI